MWPPHGWHADVSDLKPVTAEVPIREYLAEIRRRSDYVITVPAQRLRAANLHTALGNFWFFLNPALQVVVFYLVFGVLLKTDRGIDNFIAYLVIGVLTFNLISRVLLQASNCLAANVGLMRSLHFPRAIVPISAVATNLYNYVPGLAVIVAVVLLTGEPIRLRWLLLPVVLLLLILLTTGLAFWSARLGWTVPDLSSLLPHLTRLLFYGSGILFDPRSFTSNSAVLAIFDANPVYEVLLLLRWIFIGTYAPWYIWPALAGWSIVLLLTGFTYFWRGEASYGASR